MLQALPKKFRSQFAHHFLNPTTVLEDLDIRPGQQVLEIGMPIGFFAPALLKKVTHQGLVFVAGPNQQSFEKLNHLSTNKNLSFKLLADILTGEAFQPGQIDTVILTNLLSNTVKPDTFCMAIGQYLKPDSEIVLIDWDSKDKAVGPTMERRVTQEDALRLMHRCGMNFKRMLHLSGYHYGLVFSFKAN